jgi:hypothetical protein
LISSAEELNSIGRNPRLMNAHFTLTDDIDLGDIDLHVIGSRSSPFAGVFDGRGHTISDFSCAVPGRDNVGLFGYVQGEDAEIRDVGLIAPSIEGATGVGSLVGSLNHGIVSKCYAERGSVSGRQAVGGLVGVNDWEGAVTQCYSTGTVIGDTSVGGLVGTSSGHITWCYSTGTVTGNNSVGGLVGANGGDVTHCYSKGTVNGSENVGGLAGAVFEQWSIDPGFRRTGYAIACFWDLQTSGQMTSAEGLGKTTAEMQTATTFLDAGWDFVDETENGTEDIWWILEGKDSPRLWWEVSASSPNPLDGATDVILPTSLSWQSGFGAVEHDVYFGEDEEAVANATTESAGIYRGRQLAECTTYDPCVLDLAKRYYWRVDEINDADPNSPWKGTVWDFTTGDFFVIDDFESCNLDDKFIYDTWLDGWFNDTGSTVWPHPLWEEPTVVRRGQQSMRFDYINDNSPYYSEAYREWDIPQDWTVCGADTLTFYFHGHVDNDPSPLYVAIEDSAGRIAVIVHPDPNAVLIEKWIEWNIPFGDFAGANPAAVTKMYIGVGDRDNPQPGGEGLIFIDDIGLTQAPIPPEPDFVVVDDFESYTDESPNRIFETWVDGLGCSS